MFLAPRIDLQMSLGIVTGNGIFLTIAARDSNRILPALAVFVSSSLTKRALFLLLLLVGRPIGYCGSMREGL